jgi:hypothetical protein
MGRECSMHEEEKINAYRILVGNSEGRRPQGKPRRRWENIKMDFREIKWSSTDWINLAQDRDQRWALVNTMINLGFHKKKVNS